MSNVLGADEGFSGFKNNAFTSFGNLKVATTHTAFETLFNFDKQPLIYDESLVTGGTNTWNTNTNSINLATTTASGSSVIVQSRKRIRYIPSRSVLIQLSCNLGTPLANNRKRVGHFDANNGLFFQLNGVTPEVVIRSNTSGSIVDTAVAQSSWNIDKLNGTGDSGLTVDFSKHQLFVIEYGWQGIGSVRFGFYLNGEILYCHQVLSANNLTLPYMKTANLPIRFENTNTGAAASVSTLSVNCVSVKNYGEDDGIQGQIRTFVRPSSKTVSALPTFTPVLSIRLSAANITGIMEIISAPIYGQTADDVIWKLILNPTLTGSTFANTLGYAQIDTAATTLSGGTDMASGFVKQGESSILAVIDIFSIINSLVGSSIAGVSDILTLAASSRTTTADVLGTITWREF